MKKLVIVSLGKSTGECATQQIRGLIGEYIELQTVQVLELPNLHIQSDFVLFTSELAVKLALQYFDKDTPYIIARRVINHKNIKDVISIPIGTEVLLVNDAQSTALEAIAQLNNIGLDHVNYHPYYPGCDSYPECEVMITPGEMQLIPCFEKQIIDIGSRILDIETIYEVLSGLNMESLIKESLVNSYIRDIVEISRSIEENRRTVLESEKLLEAILNSVGHGIAFIDESGIIISVNSKFESIIGKKKKDLLDKQFSQLVEDEEIVLRDNKSWITEFEGREVLIEARRASLDRKFGYLITLNYTDRISKLGNKIRRNYERRLNRKLYTVDDYLSINNDVKTMIKKAEKFAKADATILIQGENGTGKEVLAQAIHMSSYRRRNLFIPINITAIAPNLLESELFGYEEGSFTGALKGGKMGLFEIASGGTIFIDEIGDAPIDFQVKLLRVLEEKRIRRIGGIEEIPIDVRIIAATNKNLLKLVDENLFREDLFFRLNILPLKTIPLRERKDDIKYLLKHFININFGKKKIKSVEDLFEQEALTVLENYKWRGNVRELINLVEYLSLIYEGSKFSTSSLHHYMLENKADNSRIILDSDELWVLKQIEKSAHEGIGRTNLTHIAKNQGQDIGEGKIRRIIKELEAKSLIKSHRNKKGSVITKIGIETIIYYK